MMIRTPVSRTARATIATLTAALMAGTAWSGAALAQEPIEATIRIVHISDIDRMEDDDGSGGIAKVVGAIKMAEAEHGGDVLVTLGGDFLSPSLMSGFDQGAHMVALLNEVGVDVGVPGNHEFDFGPDVAMTRLGEASFPFVSTNIVYNGAPLTQANEMVTVDGINIGFLGLTTLDTAVISSPGEDIEFLDPIATAEEAAASLREEGAHLVIALSHMDMDDDLDVLRAVRDVDFVLSGHNHELQVWYNGQQGMLEAAAQGDYVGILDLTVAVTPEEEGGVDIDWRPNINFVSTIDVAPDEEAAGWVQAYTDQLDEALNIDIGITRTELDSQRGSVRSQETAIGNLIADAMREAVGADVGITNGGGIRGDRTYDADTVLTRRDILSELPFGNTVVLLEVSGATIRAALENGVSRIEDGAGRFPQVSGLTFAFDAAAEPGSRVGDITVAGVPLDEAATYTLATNDYMAGGGDGYAAFGDGNVIINAVSGPLMATAVIDHIAAAGEVSPAIEGRIVQ